MITSMFSSTLRTLSLALGLGAAASLCSSACAAGQTCSDTLLADVGAHLGVANFSVDGYQGGIIVAAACKAQPDNPALTLAVIAYDGSVRGQKKWFLGLVDEARHRIVSSLSTLFEEEGDTTISTDSLSLDTGRYHLASGVRAVGVAITDAGPHPCPDAGSDSVAYLYVQEGDTFRPVLTHFTASMWAYVGEDKSRCGQLDAAERPIKRTQRSLSVAATRTKGYADLLVTSSARVGRHKRVERKTWLLRYDGTMYQSSKPHEGY